jgi:hypothetical protein
MEKTLKVLNLLQRKGLITRYAIGGAIGALFYMEPAATYDLDIFIGLPEGTGPLVDLSPIYAFLRQRGYAAHKEHVMIEGIPVQMLPAYNPLVQEALEDAVERKYKGVKTRVLRPEHLMAIMLQTGRAKDKARLAQFVEEAEYDAVAYGKILKKHELKEKWDTFKLK